MYLLYMTFDLEFRIFKSSSNIWATYVLVRAPEDDQDKTIHMTCMNKRFKLKKNQVPWMKIRLKKLLEIPMY